MFDSGVFVKDLVAELNAEADVALDIPNSAYVDWLNSLQQTLYTEIIKEQKKTVLTDLSSSPISIDTIGDKTVENTPRFEDIYAVYADGVQLMKSTLTSGVVFPNTYYKDNNNIGYNTDKIPSEMTIVYIVKPLLVTMTSHGNINESCKVMLPIEFIELAKSKLRGEAYKLVNEDGLSAKWLNDYNVLLETFKVWVTDKSPNFGI